MSRRPRLLLLPPRYPTTLGAWVPLTPQENHHIECVLRTKTGEVVEIFDGAHRKALATYGISIHGEPALFLAETTATDLQASQTKITLLQGLLKNDKFDWVIEKATELGVHRLIAVACEHSVVTLDEQRAVSRLKRWQTIAKQAAQQCQRSDVPMVEYSSSFAQALHQTQAQASFLLWEQMHQPLLWQALPKQPVDSVALLVGPEGGFAEKEWKQAQGAGFLACSLGPRILRAETAAIATLSLVDAWAQIQGVLLVNSG